MSKYIYRREQGDDNETDLKEGEGIENRNYSASIRDARSLSLFPLLI